MQLNAIHLQCTICPTRSFHLHASSILQPNHQYIVHFKLYVICSRQFRSFTVTSNGYGHICVFTVQHTYRRLVSVRVPFSVRTIVVYFKWHNTGCKCSMGDKAKIHLKDIDDGALHFCILFLWTLSSVTV
jgi:hypothetical protein